MESPDLMRKRLSILGSTGSIGTQALEVAEKHGFPVAGLAACSNVAVMEEQIRRHRPRLAALFDEEAAADLRVRTADLPVICTSHSA